MNTNIEPSGKFWESTLGAIVKITGLIVAITGLIVAVKPFIDNRQHDTKREVPVVVINYDSIKESLAKQKHIDEESQKKIPPSPHIINYESIATSVASQWFADIKNGNVEGLVSSSSIPFYADNQILTSLTEVRDYYTLITKKVSEEHGNNGPVMTLTKLKIWKASELKNKGIDLTHDRLFSSLNLEEDPFVGELVVNNKDGIEIVFRKVGESLKIAGEWD